MVAPAASGIFKQIRIDAETTYGVAPVASDVNAYVLRRASCDISPQLATFKSNEIRPDRQLITYRHGTQTIRGTLRGELSTASYKDIFASLLAGAFTAGAISSITAATNTLTYVAAANGVAATITRTTGSWITDGLKWGDLFRIAGSGVAANNARNFRILGLTSTTITVSRVPSSAADAALINGSLEALTAGTDTSGTVTFTVTGKKLTTPDPFAGGTLLDPSFTLEQYFSDQGVYELYTGCKPTEIRMNFVPSGISSFECTFLGQKYSNGSGQYFTAATGAATTNAASGVSGTIRVDDLDLGLVTNLNMTITGGHSVDPVIGTPFVPFVFPGVIDISGSLSILFYDETFFNVAVNETEVDLILVQTLNPGIANSDHISFKMPRIKLNSVQKDDGAKAIIGSYSFQALKYTAGGTGTAYDNTTLVIQDTNA